MKQMSRFAGIELKPGLAFSSEVFSGRSLTQQPEQNTVGIIVIQVARKSRWRSPMLSAEAEVRPYSSAEIAKDHARRVGLQHIQSTLPLRLGSLGCVGSFAPGP